MATKPPGFDSQNTTPKEIIRRNIRHALSNKSVLKFPDLDLSKELFAEMEKPAELFVHNFRAAGGKFIPCAPANFFETLLSIIKGLEYHTVLCADPVLNQKLKDEGIPMLDTLFTHSLADATLFFSDTLIARNGSILFKQENTQFPSVKQLSKDILVVADIASIVPDLKNALRRQNEKRMHSPAPLIEILTPAFIQTPPGEIPLSADTGRRFILFLIC